MIRYEGSRLEATGESLPRFRFPLAWRGDLGTKYAQCCVGSSVPQHSVSCMLIPPIIVCMMLCGCGWFVEMRRRSQTFGLVDRRIGRRVCPICQKTIQRVSNVAYN